MIAEFKSIIDLLKAFPDEQSCINHLEILRWNGNVISPFNHESKVYKCKGNKYRCKETKKYFNVKTGTIFDDTKIPLQKWFMALYIFSSHKKGISSHQLSRDITVTQKSAWFMLHRLRYAFDHPAFQTIVGKNPVEIDETYYGGDEKNKHANKRTKLTRGRSLETKKPILGLKERNGNLVAKVIKNASVRSLHPILTTTIRRGSYIFTDEWRAYKNFSTMFKHKTVSHSAREYVNGQVHVNGVENFWSHLKRGLDGIYHWVSVPHLQSYVNEYSLRYNTRSYSTSNRFDMILGNVTGKKITYQNLINK